MRSCFIIVFFNDTATTEIYTYSHTLSLHDALPIYRRRAVRPVRRHQLLVPEGLRLQARQVLGHAVVLVLGRRLLRCLHAAVCRSEEHTSELQSLMRISYAVFCLKKKNSRIRIKMNTTRSHSIQKNNTTQI